MTQLHGASRLGATTVHDPVLQRFRDEVNRIYGDRVARVVLFGSRARGDHGRDSDYDIAVFLDDYDNWFDEVLRLANVTVTIFYETGEWISPKPFLARDYSSSSSFMGSVRSDGVEF